MLYGNMIFKILYQPRARQADRIAVCRQGNIVEIGGTDDVLNHPHDKYKVDLVSSEPRQLEKDNQI
jgi:ABC-type dipeptide/oligopeptide/nickel transport system ATPase component